MHRYGITPASNDAARIISLLESPGDLDHDPHFRDRKDEVLQYLADRAPDLEQLLHQMRIEHSGPTSQEPPDRSSAAGLTPDFDESLGTLSAKNRLRGSSHPL